MASQKQFFSRIWSKISGKNNSTKQVYIWWCCAEVDPPLDVHESVAIRYYTLEYEFRFRGHELHHRRSSPFLFLEITFRREKHRDEHEQFLATSPAVITAGSWRRSAKEPTPEHSLILVRGSRQTVRSLVGMDPYVQNGLVAGVRVREWTIIHSGCQCHAIDTYPKKDHVSAE